MHSRSWTSCHQVRSTLNLCSSFGWSLWRNPRTLATWSRAAISLVRMRKPRDRLRKLSDCWRRVCQDPTQNLNRREKNGFGIGPESLKLMKICSLGISLRRRVLSQGHRRSLELQLTSINLPIKSLPLFCLRWWSRQTLRKAAETPSLLLDGDATLLMTCLSCFWTIRWWPSPKWPYLSKTLGY